MKIGFIFNTLKIDSKANLLNPHTLGLALAGRSYSGMGIKYPRKRFPTLALEMFGKPYFSQSGKICTEIGYFIYAVSGDIGQGSNPE